MSDHKEELDAVMRRLRKILALAESSEPGEAAAALHQARAIMDKYGLDAVDARSSAVEEFECRLSTVAISGWEESLGHIIEKALGVKGLIKSVPAQRGVTRPRSKLVFLGETGKAKLAGYAFEVLRRQLRSGWDKQIVEMAQRGGEPIKPTDLKRVLPKKYFEAYAKTWCYSVHQKVAALAQAPSEATLRKADKMKTREPDQSPGLRRRPAAKQDPISMYLMRRGLEDGNAAQIHNPVGSSNESRPRITG